ncbi:hypothetical protein EXIGLDRAFT_370179 [Exidia glandulosa HHB12029]|uniref:Uncharacterized protein n=1 Tax=Exidia glandulosa HHB12029 TaxID=1314781 RepID=A0A165C266_EXIGL|nr:hypothetical protein EXIGLDRAFT_370179 [Exidia glandulosa HHB12029]
MDLDVAEEPAPSSSESRYQLAKRQLFPAHPHQRCRCTRRRLPTRIITRCKYRRNQNVHSRSELLSASLAKFNRARVCPRTNCCSVAVHPAASLPTSSFPDCRRRIPEFVVQPYHPGPAARLLFSTKRNRVISYSSEYCRAPAAPPNGTNLFPQVLPPHYSQH